MQKMCYSIAIIVREQGSLSCKSMDYIEWEEALVFKRKKKSGSHLISITVKISSIAAGAVFADQKIQRVDFLMA